MPSGAPLPRVALLSLVAGAATAARDDDDGAALHLKGDDRDRRPPRGQSRTIPLSGPSADFTDRIDKEAIGTHVRKLMSTDLTLRMMKELRLRRANPSSTPRCRPRTCLRLSCRRSASPIPAPSETDEDRVLTAYAKAMKIAQVRETRNIIIEFTTSDPQFSARGANRLAELYRESLTGSRREETADAASQTQGARSTR